MSETLTETFARFAEDAEFRQWSEGRTPESRRRSKFRFVYARHNGSLWKFTPEEWWRVVTRTIRNNGAYNLPLTKTLQDRCSKKIADVENGVAYDKTIHCVNLDRWTLTNWTDELRAI